MDGHLAPTEPRVGELFGKLASDTGLLLRQEVALAAVEMKDTASAAMGRAWLIGAGVAMALIGGHTLVAAAVLGLSMVLPLWLAALATGAVVTLTGSVAIGLGRTALARLDFTPRKTIESLLEGRTWARELVR